MAKTHFCNHCHRIPEDVRLHILSLRNRNNRAAGGKRYWSDGARSLGVIENDHGLFFTKETSLNREEEADVEQKIEGER
jgi:hypothetical protein